MCATHLSFVKISNIFDIFVNLNLIILLLQISEIKMANIPDTNLSQLGPVEYGSFTVEVIDPVSDYVELMEVSD